MIAIPISIALGSLTIRLPILLGGGLMILLAVFLAQTMTEEGFTPTPPEDRTTWAMMLKTVWDARGVVRRQPLLLPLLGIGLFYGLYSEGFDRLWTPHLLERFVLPSWLEGMDAVVWFGVIRGVLAAVSLVATEVVLYWAVGVMRSIRWPLASTWFNQRIDDPQVRATMFSVRGQVDAVGQIGSGPIMGVTGNASIRAALVASAVILSSVLPLYWITIRRDEQGRIL